jgi:hypothetical protein
MTRKVGFVKVTRLAGHQPYGVGRAANRPHLLRFAVEDGAAAFTVGFGQSELEMALTIGEHGEAIVGRVDQGPADGSVRVTIDDRAVNCGYCAAGSRP